MADTQPLPISDVLSVTTGRLVSRDHMGGVYRVCDFMTGDRNFTHQLPRVMQEVRPEILRQHPWLADIEIPDFEKTGSCLDGLELRVWAWLDTIEAEHGETVDLAPMAPEDHTPIHPVAELQMMGVPADRIITIEEEAP